MLEEAPFSLDILPSAMMRMEAGTGPGLHSAVLPTLCASLAHLFAEIPEKPRCQAPWEVAEKSRRRIVSAGYRHVRVRVALSWP